MEAASLNQLAEILAERAGRQFDIPFKEEMKVVINYWRVRLLVDTLNSRPKDRQFFVRWIDFPLVEVNRSDFPGYPDCPILRTKCKIPVTVRANSKLYDFVGKLNRMTTIQVRQPYEIAALLGGVYTGKNPRAALINEYLYVFGDLSLPGIAVALIPENIDEYNACCEECGSSCLTHDEPYPVSADLQQRIIQAIIATEFRNPARPETKLNEVEISNNEPAQKQ